MNAHEIEGANIHVALIRGINVGGNKKIPMKELSAVFADVGCDNVRTYIQSGNVVFSAPEQIMGDLSTRIEEALFAHVGFTAPVVTRTAGEFIKIYQSNSYLEAGIESRSLHIAFLADMPNAGNVASLEPNRSPGDEFTVQGREIYLHLPNGLGRTKFANDYFDCQLRTISTMRIWRTVQKLVEMTRPDS